jgi:hypothetical protein
VMSEDAVKQASQLRADAIKAAWTLIIINLFVALFFLLGEREFVFLAMLIQLPILLLWLIPMFLYQTFFKGLSPRIALYKSLASYRNIMEQVDWP